MNKPNSGLTGLYFVLLYLLLSALLLADSAQATTYYVKPTGSDANSGLTEALAWQHVMKACSTLTAGDTVLIRSGTYDETSNLNGTAWGYPIQKGLVPTNTGTAGNPIVFKGYPGDVRPIIVGKSPRVGAPNATEFRMGALIDDGWNYITYDSIEFRKGSTGIFLQGGGMHDIIVRNCVIDSMLGLGGAPTDDNAGGILAYFEWAPYRCTFEGNEIFACGAWDVGSGNPNYRMHYNTGGIYLYSCDSCMIRNNVIHDVQSGIQFKEEARYTEVYGNTIYNIAQAAMWAHFGQTGLGYTGPDHIMSRWHHNTVYESAIGFQVGFGMITGTYDDTLLYIYNNTFDCTNSAAWADSSGDTRWGGIQGDQGGFGKVYFFNNIIYNPPVMSNISFEDHSGAFNLWSNWHPIFDIYEDYNLLYGQGSFGQYYAINSTEYTLAQWQAANITEMVAGQGANSLVADPLFTDAVNHDYTLQAGSPAASGGKGGSFTFFPGTSVEETVTLPTYFGASGTSTPDSSVRISDAPAITEGNSLIFPITIGLAFESPCVITFSTANGTAVAPGDYVPIINGQITIPAGSTTGSIGIATVNDTTLEQTETMTLTLSNVSIGTIGRATGTGTIMDNDTIPMSRIGLESFTIYPITVSGTYAGYTTAPIADNNIDPYGGTATTWASDESNTEAHWIVASFEHPLTFTGITIYWAWNTSRSSWATSQQYLIQAWNGTALVDLAAVNTVSATNSTNTVFPPFLTDSIRIYQPAGQGPIDYNSIMWLTELQMWAPLDTIPPAALNDLK